MREIPRRCNHCRTFYTYQASGYGCMDNYNDDKYCKTCKKKIVEALQQIPVRYQERFPPVAEVERVKHITAETLIGWERQNAEDNKGKLVGTRVFSSLFNLETGDSMHSRMVIGRGDSRMFKFKLDTWRLSEETDVMVQMEYDLIDDKYTGSTW